MSKPHGTNRAVFMARSLDLCLMLHGGKRFTVRTISEYFGVCKRTGYRYLAAVSEILPTVTEKIDDETFHYIPEGMRKLRRSA
ncbi:hypothetical protein KAR91_09050 [Candidatus Pacearchaeota archaeon]|nr:hypothetical protein [Candidatus Pacearchaeota archaeon]